MTSVSVLFPWREHPDPWRTTLREWTARRWATLFPFAERVSGSGPLDGPFNRSAAINQAFEKSIGDVLIIADTDTVPSQWAVMDAIKYAAAGEWVLPYTTYYNLKQQLTEAIVGQDPNVYVHEPLTWEHKLGDSVSGCVVLPAKAFRHVRGFDERFTGWGAEDRAFEAAMSVLWGPVRRIETFVCHLWHEARESTRFESPYWPNNSALYAAYDAARGNREAMMTVLRSRI